MSYEVDAAMSQPPDEVWTDQAVAGLIGQRPTVQGQPGEVTDAWKDDDGRVFVRLRVDADPAPFNLERFGIPTTLEDDS